MLNGQWQVCCWGVILELCPANERRRYIAFHWQGANLESTLLLVWERNEQGNQQTYSPRIFHIQHRKGQEWTPKSQFIFKIQICDCWISCIVVIVGDHALVTVKSIFNIKALSLSKFNCKASTFMYFKCYNVSLSACLLDSIRCCIHPNSPPLLLWQPNLIWIWH